MRAVSGWIPLSRDWLDHPLLKDGERFRAWCWLVANAAWKPTRHDIKGKIVILEKGQLCISRERLAEIWGWSPSAVERFLTRLKTEQMIGRETGQGKSVITICDYVENQNLDDETGQATGQATGQKSDRDRTTKEQGNNLTREESKKEKKERKSSSKFGEDSG